MRPNGFSVVATLVLVSTAFVTHAVAQQNRRGGGGFSGPQISAPAPHIAAPAPHFEAPHVAAPVQHFTAPHIAAPTDIASPRGTLHHITGERLAPPGPSAVAGHNLAPGLSTVGQGPAAHSHNLAETSQTLIQGANHREILRNPTFAGLSSRDPATSTLARSTFQGKFARSSFAREFDWRRHREHFGFVLGFVGPLFWPYAFDDFIDYTFWPYAYDTFWPYAFDDVYDGIYGPYAPEYHPSGRGRSRTAALTEGAPRICTGETAGLTDFPVERIVQQVQPDQDQQRLLDDLKAATGKAVGILQAACPTELPSTPTGRLAAMRQRVEVMLQAVQLVRPTLEKFYQSLSDEQKERFNALDESNGPAGRQRQQPDVAQLCGGRGPQQIANLPTGQIERSLRLSDAQEAALKELNDTSAKAADILRVNCPAEQTLTPTGRLAAMEQRLDAMLQAMDTVQPALAKFYDSLSDEQKARVDRLSARPT
jgi:LTXXQ motif family protein